MVKLKLLGKKFGKLLVVEELKPKNKHSFWMCKCECGNTRNVEGASLTLGRVTCCGCDNGDVRRRVKHHNRQLYEVWKGMRARCRYKKHIGWKNYGGVGVMVCEEWDKSFISFYKWCMDNGWKPGLQVDKDIIPKKLGLPATIYSPEMCCLVTHEVNGRHSKMAKLTQEIANFIRGSKEKTSYLASKYNVSMSCIQRIKNNSAWREKK